MAESKEIRLVELADRARRLGRIEQANRFLLLAWLAHDNATVSEQNCDQFLPA